MSKKALLVVDFQNDFITGSLAVKGAENLVKIVDGYVKHFVDMKRHIVFSRDYHPQSHSSFVDQGGPWPPHCVEYTTGAEIHSGVFVPGYAKILNKGQSVEEDEYSIFANPEMIAYLKRNKVVNLYICGLATDYCVNATVLDALEQFKGNVFVLTDAIAAVDVNKGDGRKALKEMVDRGAKLISSIKGIK